MGEGLTDRIGDLLKEKVSADEFSGCVLVARDETSIFRQAYGLANQRYGIPNRVDTKYNLGSCTKVFTKVAIMQLAENGALSLEDRVSRHLPGYPSGVADRVTISHLLNHSSGMGNFWNDRFEASKSRLRTVDDFVGLFAGDPLSFEPGSRVQYSNAGYVLLGKIVEVVSGRDYYDYVREHIYGPAGMENSDHYESDLPVPNLAVGYTRMDEQGHKRGGPRRSNLLMLGVKGSPAGGGYSTVDDMLRFCGALRGNRLTSKEYTQHVYSSPVPGQDKGTKLQGFGMSGGAPGIGATFKMYFDTGYTKVVLSNYDPEAMESVSKRIEEILSSGH